MEKKWLIALVVIVCLALIGGFFYIQWDRQRLSEKRRYKDLPFDIQLVPSAGLKDLDLDLFNKVDISDNHLFIDSHGITVPEMLSFTKARRNARSPEHSR